MNILIRKATENDYKLVSDIGQIAVAEAHSNSCSKADMDHYLSAHYNEAAIRGELANRENIYHLIFCNQIPAGFSKIVLDAPHQHIAQPKVTKLDRIYLLSDFYDKKLGFYLLSHNIELSKENGQCGMWLFTWTGNERAVNFYKKAGFTIIGSHMFKVSDTHANPNHHMFLEYTI